MVLRKNPKILASHVKKIIADFEKAGITDRLRRKRLIRELGLDRSPAFAEYYSKKLNLSRIHAELKKLADLKDPRVKRLIAEKGEEEAFNYLINLAFQADVRRNLIESGVKDEAKIKRIIMKHGFAGAFEYAVKRKEALESLDRIEEFMKREVQGKKIYLEGDFMSELFYGRTKGGKVFGELVRDILKNVRPEHERKIKGIKSRIADIYAVSKEFDEATDRLKFYAVRELIKTGIINLDNPAKI